MEALLRLSATLLLVLTALLVGLDSQTRLIFFVQKKASFTVLNALEGLVYATSIAAAYNFLQLCRYTFPYWFEGNSKKSYRYLAWLCYILDQVTVYVVFATTSAALEQSLLAITGAKSVQWMKLCNKFTRFCFQIGGAICCAYIASIILILVASISAFNLFRLYSPKKFLLVKGS
ncbi:hypothetical protein SLEP1_g53988 [Rubroshorea leprosula]|uniref:CASP-like protein n=1 Tax=Rubroshorea leprosula TaxID=152421 RepID=A0AAV5MDG2_9ROSI|nr:hypothetical protein SLEP1_g53988 [Rubroshorea leprosula]